MARPGVRGLPRDAPIFKQIVADYSDRALFVVRYLPLHRNSLYAAAVLEEARELGKFNEALDILFDRQPEWGDHRNPKPEESVRVRIRVFNELVETGGLLAAAHLPFPSVGHVAVDGDAFRSVPVIWDY